MAVLGTAVEASQYRPARSVIGGVELTAVGNVVLRIGREVATGGWEQTEYIVLSPDEATYLIEAVRDARDRNV